ncbi:response regulator transcription factor [Candidatus Spyradosoma sp. SGI.093]|uniref:response regulator transcription factor n=1 Tax=Candidatus Spyradosoma sp. SGI.093 TaxID=3420583 RepID=UPI003D01BCA7
MKESARVPVLLLLEDDLGLRERLAKKLAAEGFGVEEAGDVAEARYLLGVRGFDALVTDVMLPDGNGIELLREIRGRDAAFPVIVLTAFGGVEGCLRGFGHGADDYVLKPVDARELAARVRNALRRIRRAPEVPVLAESGADAPVLRLEDGGVFDLRAREYRRGAARAALSTRECALLRCLAERRGGVVSEAELLVRVWRKDAREADSARVRSLVSRLRRKVGGDAGIRAVYGQGYALKAEDLAS